MSSALHQNIYFSRTSNYDNCSPLVFCQSIAIKVYVVLESLERHCKHVVTRGQGHMTQDRAHVVIDVVNFLFISVHYLISVEDHVSTKKTWEASCKSNTKETIKCLENTEMNQKIKLERIVTLSAITKVLTRPNH